MADKADQPQGCIPSTGLSKKVPKLSHSWWWINLMLGFFSVTLQSVNPVVQNQRDNDRQASYQPTSAPTYSPSICSVPESSTLMRGPWLTRGEPFLYHLILGWGVPIAWQGRVATDCSGKVWLAGPICTMGGGTSSTDVTWTLMITIMVTRMTQSCLSFILGASF